MLKSKRSKACDIKKSVKDKVWQRDNCRCIICGSPFAMPNAHFIARSKGGLGVEQNIVTLCQRCHNTTDQQSIDNLCLVRLKNICLVSMMGGIKKI